MASVRPEESAPLVPRVTNKFRVAMSNHGVEQAFMPAVKQKEKSALAAEVTGSRLPRNEGCAESNGG